MSDIKQPLPEVSTTAPTPVTPAAAPDADRDAPTTASGGLLSAAELQSEPTERDHNEDLPSYNDAMSSIDSNPDQQGVITPASPAASRASTFTGNDSKGGAGGAGVTTTAAEPIVAREGGIQGRPTMGERFHRISSAAGKGFNKAAHIVGAEGWWPSTGANECLKSARILHSFTQTELGATEPARKSGPMHPTGLTRRSPVKIPTEVLRSCAGLAIFNVLRAGAWHGSLSGGSGVVVARREDGSWSPPSTFLVSSVGAGIMAGLEMYDTVCVLNTRAQVDSFTKPRLALGGGGSIAVGPVGGGANVQAAVTDTRRPMWSYMKTRGVYAGLQIDGTVIVGRGDANAVFYGRRGLAAKDILYGDVAWPVAAKPLFEVLMAIDGHKVVDPELVRDVVDVPPPGDREINEETVAAAAVAADEHVAEAQGDNVMDEKERLARSGF